MHVTNLYASKFDCVVSKIRNKNWNSKNSIKVVSCGQKASIFVVSKVFLISKVLGFLKIGFLLKNMYLLKAGTFQS